MRMTQAIKPSFVKSIVFCAMKAVLCLIWWMATTCVRDLSQGAFTFVSNRRSWEWIDERTFVCRERCISADRKRLFSREIVTSVGRGVVRDQFYSERLYSRNEIVALLRENGLAVEEDADTGTHGPSTSVHTAAKDMSRRGQDLGMMGQRLLIFATKMRSDSKLHSPPDQLGRVALNETSITRTHPSQYHHKPQGPPFWLKNDVGWFGVVMGDVTLPCREKLNNVWNMEDLETRQKLVHALTECGYTRDQVGMAK